MTKKLEQLWEMLDAEIEKAIPIQKRIKAIEAKQNEDPASADEYEIERLEANLEKYKEAGAAPGLAKALHILLEPAFDNYQAVVKHSQARIKAKAAGEKIDTPTGFVTGDRIPPGQPPTEDVKASGGQVDEPDEAQAQKPPPRRRRSTPDPGPSASDIPADVPHTHIPGDINMEQLRKHDPEAAARVEAALAQARADSAARQAAKTRQDDTEEQQHANHVQDLGEIPSDPEPDTADDIAAQLAALEEA